MISIMKQFPARSRYPGQHPAESVLDAILSMHLGDRVGIPAFPFSLAQKYFDFRTGLLRIYPASDREFKNAALANLKAQIDDLTANIDPPEGWPLTKEDVRDRLKEMKETFELVWNN